MVQRWSNSHSRVQDLYTVLKPKISQNCGPDIIGSEILTEFARFADLVFVRVIPQIPGVRGDPLTDVYQQMMFRQDSRH